MFGKKKTPQEQAKEWKQTIRTQRHMIERQSRKIEREEDRLKLKVKDMIKKGQGDACMPLVAELANSKKARSKFLKACTQLDSLIRQIDLQLAQVKVAGCFQKSTEITQMMNQMVKLPEIQATMQKLQMEMEKSGVTEEMLNDAMDTMDDTSPEDQELATKLVYNQLVSEINKAQASRNQAPLQTIPIDPSELQENPDLVKLATS